MLESQWLRLGTELILLWGVIRGRGIILVSVLTLDIDVLVQMLRVLLGVYKETCVLFHGN